jgi:hypothetical protein
MNEAGIAAVGMAAVAMVGTVVNSIIGYRSNRDKMQFDTKLLMLERAEEQCREDRKECKEETTIIKEKLKSCEEHHEMSARDREVLWAEVEKLKSMPKV